MTIMVERLDAAVRARMIARANAPLFEPAIMEAGRRAIGEVRARGEAAVLEYTQRFDGVELSAGTLRVSPDEIHEAREAMDPALHAAIERAVERTRRFNERLRPASWMEELDDGIRAGVRFVPFDRVGLYIPSGKGRFPSTVVTLVTPAVVAGVGEITVVVPPRRDGSVDPAVLFACELLGVRRIIRCNGVAGVAALAVGTEQVPVVPALAGPGNPYVVATQLAAQELGVRVLALLGPTESMILADRSADPQRLAVDLVNEAEHGTDSAAILVTDDAPQAEAVARLVPGLLARLPEERRVFARAALQGGGGIVVVPAMPEAVAFVNDYAPEHLQIATRDPEATAAQIRHAGEILLGQHTPFSAGNYAIGVPAALPTSGTARAASGITVLSYLKVTYLAELTPTGLAGVRPVVEALGTYEGFPAHVMAVMQR